MMTTLYKVKRISNSELIPVRSLKYHVRRWASVGSMAPCWSGAFTLAQHHERLKPVAHVETAQVPGCGHMLHHDQPQAVAQLIERFLDAPSVRK